MLNLRLAQRWERLGDVGADIGGMLLFGLMAGLLVWGAYAMAYPEYGCVRMGKGNSGPLECNPRTLRNNAVGLLLLAGVCVWPIAYVLWGWIKNMARPLTLDEE